MCGAHDLNCVSYSTGQCTNPVMHVNLSFVMQTKGKNGEDSLPAGASSQAKEPAPNQAREAIKPQAAEGSTKSGKAGQQDIEQVKADEQQAATGSTGKTVFVRSLPADVSKDQLHIAFRKFGSLRACRSATASTHPQGPWAHRFCSISLVIRI